MIKFRAWDEESQRMFDIARFDFADYTVYSHLFACDGYLGENLEIMQFTGLSDRNSVEIFEGDIVEIQDISGNYINSGIVKKGKGFFFIENYEGNKITLLSDFYLKSYTNTLELCVIGNIYEGRGEEKQMERFKVRRTITTEEIRYIDAETEEDAWYSVEYEDEGTDTAHFNAEYGEWTYEKEEN